jgi:hypothetical protein
MCCHHLVSDPCMCLLALLLLLLQAPISLPVEGKLVYSPHVYGPDVFGQPYFSDPSFPDNLPDIWSRHFGCVAAAKHCCQAVGDKVLMQSGSRISFDISLPSAMRGRGRCIVGLVG